MQCLLATLKQLILLGNIHISLDTPYKQATSVKQPVDQVPRVIVSYIVSYRFHCTTLSAIKDTHTLCNS